MLTLADIEPEALRTQMDEVLKWWKSTVNENYASYFVARERLLRSQYYRMSKQVVTARRALVKSMVKDIGPELTKRWLKLLAWDRRTVDRYVSEQIGMERSQS